MTEDHVSLEELLGQSVWLRRLAGTLVAGEAAADDLVQETWLAALRHPPDPDRPLRPWLDRVARNLASRFRRSEARRRAREAEASPAEPVLDASAFTSEVEAQRLLAEALLRLEEPLRAVVVMRYLHGEDSRAIGRRLGVPDGTVRWRLKRALECLRADLDRRFGERRAWSVAIAGLARHGAGARPTAGVLGSSMKLAATGALAAAGVIVFCGAWWIAGRSEPRSMTSAKALIAAELASAPDESDVELATPDRGDEPARTPRSTGDEPDTDSNTAASPAGSGRKGPVHGQLRIANALGLPTEERLDEVLTIRLRSGDLSVKETVRSASDGSFRSQRSFPRGFVLGEVLRPAGDPAGDCEATFDPSSDEGLVFPVPWPNFVRGRLVDCHGEELKEVQVSLVQGGTDEFGPLDHQGFSFTDLDLGPCTVTVRHGFEHYEFSTIVKRGPNELGDVLVPFRERAGSVSGRLRSVYGEPKGSPKGSLFLTDLATGVTYKADAGASSKGVSEFEFEEVPRGDYRLTLFSEGALRYADRTRFLRPPVSDVEFVAIGENEPLRFRALDGDDELPAATAWVLSSGRWRGLDSRFDRSFEPRDVERWILVAKDHRPASGRGLESTHLDVRLESGWGCALFFTEMPDGRYWQEKGAVAGVEVRADGVLVARSDEDGVALVSLPRKPGKLECGLDGWVMPQARSTMTGGVDGIEDGEVVPVDGWMCADFQMIRK